MIEAVTESCTWPNIKVPSVAAAVRGMDWARSVPTSWSVRMWG